MGFIVSTDVECDECLRWEYGATGTRIKKREAWAQAQHKGFVRVNGRMLCNYCAARRTHEEETRDG